MRHVSKLTILLARPAWSPGAPAAACSRKSRRAPVVGERIAVLANEADIEIEPATAAMPMSLPAAAANDRLGAVGRQCPQVYRVMSRWATRSASPGPFRSAKAAATRAGWRRAGRCRRPRLHDRHDGHGARIRRVERRAGVVGALRRHRRQQRRDLWRRRRLRQWPRLRDQRSWLCRGARCRHRRGGVDG